MMKLFGVSQHILYIKEGNVIVVGTPYVCMSVFMDITITTRNFLIIFDTLYMHNVTL